MKILIVEDNEPNRKLFEVLLARSGYEVITADNGESGIERTITDHPDLILMDIQMPHLDGVAALKRLRKLRTTAAIPVIALTAYAMRGDRERFLAEGFDDHIAKPIHTESFFKAIERFHPKKTSRTKRSNDGK